MAKLSVNLNKVATIRNARGGNRPSVLRAMETCIQAGAHGITVHPRPDERHIRRTDVYDLKEAIAGRVEFNIEGYPSDEFVSLVLEVCPEQCTLVPDPPDVLTSNAGWDLSRPQPELQACLARLRDAGIRSSIFVEADPSTIAGARALGADRVELYTEAYAVAFASGQYEAVLSRFAESAKVAAGAGLGVNAGHDLDQDNLATFARALTSLDEVSIGHALISDALYEGLETTVKRYLACLS